jgi:hypothetical protein
MFSITYWGFNQHCMENLSRLTISVQNTTVSATTGKGRILEDNLGAFNVQVFQKNLYAIPELRTAMQLETEDTLITFRIILFAYSS